MDKREQAQRLKEEGYEPYGIKKKLGITIGYIYLLLRTPITYDDYEKPKGAPRIKKGDFLKQIAKKRQELLEKEKEIKQFLPFHCPQDKINFHRTQDQIDIIYRDLRYFEKRQQRNESTYFFDTRKVLSKLNKNNA